jgi:hypothetical protein
VDRFSDLLKASEDVLAGLILHFADEYVREHGFLSERSAEWLARRMVHVRLVPRPGDPNARAVDLITCAQAGIPHSEDEEKYQSALFWAGKRPSREA